MEQRPSHRSCGPCTACCKPFAIEEVQKLDGNWCQHRIAGTGCAIYKDRPFACQKYSCVWLAGKGNESDRPDLTGFMMDMSDSRVGNRDFGIFHLYEIELGSLQTPRAVQLAKALRDQGCVIAYHEQSQGGASYATRLRVPMEFFTDAECAAIEQMHFQRQLRGL